MPAPPLPRAGEHWALFLDIDGTLVEIAPTPQQVRLEPALRPLLERLWRQCGGALALVTGRPLASADALFHPLLLPAAGLHGIERRRSDGRIERVAEVPAALTALRPILAEYAEAWPGVLFEDKELSLALHYRLAPQHGRAVRAAARQLARSHALHLIEGDKVVELQGPGGDKGRAIEAFLGEPPFRERRPVFAGDDTTDEHGFRAVERAGGITVKVDGAHRPRSATEARYRLPNVAAMHRWLEGLAETLGDDPALQRGTTAALPC